MDYTLQQTFDAARGYLHDTQVPGGEDFTNSVLQPHLNVSYRKVFNQLQGVSKRVERFVYVNLPANSSTVLIPSQYNITDLSEPEMVEERTAGTAINITDTSNTTPVNVHAPGHELSTGVEGIVSQVAGSAAPWGQWFITVVDANNFTLNGSVKDGAVGTGGIFTLSNANQFSEVQSIDLPCQGLDYQPQDVLGQYLWMNSRFNFAGANNVRQLRITYWASGDPPTIPSIIINIDSAIDVIACGTAASAAEANGWWPLSERLFLRAYGDDTWEGNGGLMGNFLRNQVLTLQKGPQRRQLPFRTKQSRFGSWALSG